MKRKKKTDKQKKPVFKALKTFAKLFWQEDKRYFAVLFFLTLFGALNGLINLLLPKLLIDGFNQGWDFSVFSRAILAFVAAKYVMLQLEQFFKRKDKIHAEYLRNRIPMVFAEKVMRLPYPSLEDPDILDLKERAIFPVTSYGALQNMLTSVVSMLTGVFTLGGLLVLLFTFSPLFLLILLVLAGISILLSARFTTYMRIEQQKLIPINRRYGYWANTSHRPNHQKEFRLYGLSEVIDQKINAYAVEMMQWINQLRIRLGNNSTLQALITAIMRVLAYGYAALRVFGSYWGPQITLGDYSVIVMATENFFTTFMRSFTGFFEIVTMINHLLPFAEFMELDEAESKGGSIPTPLDILSFEHVSFHYPSAERQILVDISFEIRKGEKISIVGLNNAGKSTIVKLICRLFEPQQGRILWNGKDIREFDYKAYLEQLSAVFQDFFLFPFTLRNNIDPQGQGDDEKIRAVLEETDLTEVIDRLDQGIDTYLDKNVWQEATELSGGERQKIAIARSLFRPAGLVILDEPTAALDPLAESEVYEHFHELTRGRTAIFISHRMSSSTFCDRILLLQDGKVAAFDSHQNLMRGHNLYRELFEAQAVHFREQAMR